MEDGSPADAGDAGPALRTLTLPDGPPGIGFDDLRFAPLLGKILAPGGRTGKLDLVDPETLDVVAIDGFSSSAMFSAGSHEAGTTSADEAGDVLLALDHESMSVKVIDPTTRAIRDSTSLAAAPDYVRFVKLSGEIWVTEPFTGIEVLSWPESGAPEHLATIDVGGGPEAIVIDGTRNRVYTNAFTGNTYAVDIAERKVVETWPNGCGLSLGLALDEPRGFLFVACQTGSIVVLDVANGGMKLGELSQGAGLDILSYDPSLHHLYVQGSSSADLGILGISSVGTPALLGSVPTAASSTSTTDERRHVFVADPAAGGLIRIDDSYPQSE